MCCSPMPCLIGRSLQICEGNLLQIKPWTLIGSGPKRLTDRTACYPEFTQCSTESTTCFYMFFIPALTQPFIIYISPYERGGTMTMALPIRKKTMVSIMINCMLLVLFLQYRLITWNCCYYNLLICLFLTIPSSQKFNQINNLIYEI